MNPKKPIDRKWHNQLNQGLFQLFLLFFAVFCFSSCQLFFLNQSFIPKDLSKYKEGSFSGSVTFYQKNKKYYFQGDFFILEKDQIRVDFSAFGRPLFTLLYQQKNITVLLLRQKEFYKGSLASFRRQSAPFLTEELLGLLSDLLFDRSPVCGSPVCGSASHLAYVCQKDPLGRPVSCHNKKWHIQWQRNGKRTLSLKQANFEWHFQYASFSPKVDKTLFDVTIPKDFKPVFLLK